MKFLVSYEEKRPDGRLKHGKFAVEAHDWVEGFGAAMLGIRKRKAENVSRVELAEVSG